MPITPKNNQNLQNTNLSLAQVNNTISSLASDLNKEITEIVNSLEKKISTVFSSNEAKSIFDSLHSDFETLLETKISQTKKSLEEGEIKETKKKVAELNSAFSSYMSERELKQFVNRELRQHSLSLEKANREELKRKKEEEKKYIDSLLQERISQKDFSRSDWETIKSKVEEEYNKKLEQHFRESVYADNDISYSKRFRNSALEKTQKGDPLLKKLTAHFQNRKFQEALRKHEEELLASHTSQVLQKIRIQSEKEALRWKTDKSWANFKGLITKSLNAQVDRQYGVNVLSTSFMTDEIEAQHEEMKVSEEKNALAKERLENISKQKALREENSELMEKRMDISQRRRAAEREISRNTKTMSSLNQNSKEYQDLLSSNKTLQKIVDSLNTEMKKTMSTQAKNNAEIKSLSESSDSLRKKHEELNKKLEKIDKKYRKVISKLRRFVMRNQVGTLVVIGGIALVVDGLMNALLGKKMSHEEQMLYVANNFDKVVLKKSEKETEKYQASKKIRGAGDLFTTNELGLFGPKKVTAKEKIRRAYSDDTIEKAGIKYSEIEAIQKEYDEAETLEQLTTARRKMENVYSRLEGVKKGAEEKYEGDSSFYIEMFNNAGKEIPKVSDTAPVPTSSISASQATSVQLGEL